MKLINLFTLLLFMLIITSCERNIWRYKAEKQINGKITKNIELIYDDAIDEFENHAIIFKDNDFDYLSNCLKNNGYANIIVPDKISGGIYRIEDSAGVVHFSDYYFTKLDLLPLGKEYIKAGKDNKYIFNLGLKDVDIKTVRIIDDNTRLVEYNFNIKWNNISKCFINHERLLDKNYTALFHKYDDGWHIE